MFSSSGDGSSSDFSGVSSIMGGGEDSEPMCPEMSYTNRMYGFASCFVIGWCISALAVFAISSGNAGDFAALYTLGNLCAMSSTGFLIGPKRQCKNMWKPVRIVATCMYLGMIGVTLGVAFGLEGEPGAVPLVLLCVAIQCCAAIWYSACATARWPQHRGPPPTDHAPRAATRRELHPIRT